LDFLCLNHSQTKNKDFFFLREEETNFQDKSEIKTEVMYSVVRFLSLLVSNMMWQWLSADVCLGFFLPNPLKKKILASSDH
jgi:hypothetical protein